MAEERAQLRMPDHGFGEFEVPEMPAYVEHYSKRGNTFMADQTPVYQQARWGNRRNVGGMGAYLSQVEDPTFFEALKVKRGNHGVFEDVRWAPGMDWRGNFGIASLSEVANYAGIPTRGGQLRKGAPKRSDVVERVDAFEENIRPGQGTSRFSQTNDNYVGLFDWKQRTPTIQTEVDAMLLRQMIEHNPYHISSHAARQAKRDYDRELGHAPTTPTILGDDDPRMF